MVETLHIRFLGDFSLVYGSEPVTEINTSRLRSLFAYLVLHTDAPQPRQHLAFFLWPDSDEQQALANLRNLVYVFHRRYPESRIFLKTDPISVQWDPDSPFKLDVKDFEKAIAEGRLADAVELYKGDLLPTCYDDWVIPVREALRDKYSLALEGVISQAEAEQDYHRAISYAHRLQMHDPLNEQNYCLLMRLYALAGDRAGVLRTFNSCVAVMRREFSSEPSATTLKIRDECLKTQPQGTMAQTPTPRRQTDNLQIQLTSFVGREQEIDTVRSLLAGSRLLTLLGVGGSGKSRLALRVARSFIGDYPDGVWWVDFAPIQDSAVELRPVCPLVG